MRILHVLDHSAPLHSGYTFRTLSIVREQRRLGWETFHVTSSKHPSVVLEEEAEGVVFYRTPATDAWWTRLPVLGQVGVIRALERRLETLVSELKPDILHAHSPALNGVAACSVGRRAGIPIVYEMRALWEDAAVDHGTSREGGPRYRLSRALESRVLRRADAITMICDGLRQDIVSRGIPKVTVVPNAVDLEKFTLRERDGDEVIGFIGSFYAYEGLELLLSALPALFAERPGLRVLLVGGGPEDERLRKRATASGFDGKVTFTGRVPFDEVERYYERIDVLVYPRLSMRLTELVTPLKPLEAMAMGKVLVASDIGGHRELIRNGETGLLFKAGDAHDLATKLLQLLDDRGLRARMRCAARLFVERERTWSSSVSAYASVYADLVQGRT